MTQPEIAACKARCLYEWDNVNDPPCHPSEPDWRPCPLCVRPTPDNTPAVEHEAAAPTPLVEVVEKLEQCLFGWRSITTTNAGTLGFQVPNLGPGSYQWIEEATEQAASLLTAQAQRAEAAEQYACLLIEEKRVQAQRIAELEGEKQALQQTFDLRWKADQRGIALWQAMNPGNDLTWPDRADMVSWLLEKLDAIEMAEVTGWPWPNEATLAQLAELSGRDSEGAAQLAVDLGKLFGVPPAFAAHHYIADKGAERAQAAEAERDEARAGLEKAREALEPFAAACGFIGESTPDTDSIEIAVRPFRKARAVLASLNTGARSEKEGEA